MQADPNRPQAEPHEHQPYVAPDVIMPELTFSAVLVGTVLGIIFGASSLYLVLKVGMTVSASIPIAVLSITLFRVFTRVWPFNMFIRRNATILENNIVQTTGSAGESIAFGVGVTMPALMILGYDLEITRVMLVAVLGGLLGILMMIPLRRAFIVKQHGKLTYPEGTACADVLIVGEKGGSSAKTVFVGFGVAFLYQLLMGAFRFWMDIPNRMIGFFKGAAVSLEASPALLGVGYIIGTRISCVMVAGGVLASWVLIPAIILFGEGLAGPLYPAEQSISEMLKNPGPDALNLIWHNYILYIGAGAVAAGGIISMFQALPMIIASVRSGFGDIMNKSNRSGGSFVGNLRTDRDLPMKFVILGSIGLVIAIWAAPMLEMNALGAILIVLFGFLFVTVSSRLTGEIGSSSNPISGMTVATLLLTCLIFLLIGWTGESHRLTALSIAGIVCIAASNGGTTSQDLKTGYLVGGTPSYQQIGILVGALSSALVIGALLLFLNNSATIYSKENLPMVKIDVSTLSQKQHVRGSAAKSDPKEYWVLQAKPGQIAGVQLGKYLVDESGTIRYLVDPGINGRLKERDTIYSQKNLPTAKIEVSKLSEKQHLRGLAAEADPKEYWVLQPKPGEIVGVQPGKYLVDDSGTIRYLVEGGGKVDKYTAPKATLMSLIIDGILTQKLPWALVLLGVAISVVLELSGIPSLAFAVGVYLPLSTSTPIFVGGVVRWLVDKWSKRGSAEGDMSPGVLLSSGYIAGGTIAGILVASTQISEDFANRLGGIGPSLLRGLTDSASFSMLPFGLLTVFLLLVGADKMLRPSK